MPSMHGVGDVRTTSARVGTGLVIIDSIICVAVITTLLRVRDSWMMVFCRPVIAA